MVEYKTHYRNKCDECGQAIEPNTPYYLETVQEDRDGKRVTIFRRRHAPKCLEIIDICRGKRWMMR